MDVLKAEIARKRKLLEEKELVVSPEIIVKSNSSPIGPFVYQTTNKRYFKQADLLAKDLEEYKQKYGQVDAEEDKKSVKISEGKVN